VLGLRLDRRKALATARLALGLLACSRPAHADESIVTEGVVNAPAAAVWTVLYFQPTADGKTTLRIVGMGFGADDESQKMKAFFEQGNAYTLLQLQKRFQP